MAQPNKKLRFPQSLSKIDQGWAAIIAALIALVGTLLAAKLQSGTPPPAVTPSPRRLRLSLLFPPVSHQVHPPACKRSPVCYAGDR